MPFRFVWFSLVSCKMPSAFPICLPYIHAELLQPVAHSDRYCPHLFIEIEQCSMPSNFYIFLISRSDFLKGITNIVNLLLSSTHPHKHTQFFSPSRHSECSIVCGYIGCIEWSNRKINPSSKIKIWTLFVLYKPYLSDITFVPVICSHYLNS